MRAADGSGPDITVDERDGEVFIVIRGSVLDGDAELLRAELESSAARAVVVTVDVETPSTLSNPALDALAEAGRALEASKGTLLLSGVDPLLVRRIADRGHTGVFAVVTPHDGDGEHRA